MSVKQSYTMIFVTLYLSCCSAGPVLEEICSLASLGAGALLECVEVTIRAPASPSRSEVCVSH